MAARRAPVTTSGGGSPAGAEADEDEEDGDDGGDGGAPLSSLSRFSLPLFIHSFFWIAVKKITHYSDVKGNTADLTRYPSPPPSRLPSRDRDGERSEHGGRRAGSRRDDGDGDARRTRSGTGGGTAHEAGERIRCRRRDGSRRPRDGDGKVGAAVVVEVEVFRVKGAGWSVVLYIPNTETLDGEAGDLIFFTEMRLTGCSTLSPSSVHCKRTCVVSREAGTDADIRKQELSVVLTRSMLLSLRWFQEGFHTAGSGGFPSLLVTLLLFCPLMRFCHVL